MRLRLTILAVLVIGFLALAVSRVVETSSAQSPSARSAKGPVVVELFTSEGCSSCPPADSLLRRLQAQPSMNDAELIVLGWHVDYWDRLGWKDRFSSAEFTRRQQQYAEAFASNDIYTPQMVVDGRTEFVGSDERKARAAIDAASQRPKAAVSLSIKHLGAQRVQVQADIRDLPATGGSAQVWLLLTENNLASDVRSGENQGRQLAHTAVVRLVKAAGKAPGGKDFQHQAEFEIDKQWKLQDLRAVLLLQDERDRGILGAASVPLR
ncbi:MAG: DUF1223 domain-containing protein [Terriglobales bacterium]